MIDIAHIHKEFGVHLFNFIKSKVNSFHDAEDIYHDILYKIITCKDSLNQSGSLKSWLFVIARNQIFDYYRARKHNVFVEEEPDSGSFSENKSIGVYQELEECINHFIEALPEEYKMTIIMSEIQGMKQKELAASLGLNYATVRSKVRRGREMIRQMIFQACSIRQDVKGRFSYCEPSNSKCCLA